MNAKEKTAVISTSLNILLTLFKFVLFAFTGSLAILAEAWHSFSDIATSFLVFLAVFEKDKPTEDAAKGEKTARSSLPEQIVSFAIGLLLSVVSALLIVKFFSADAEPVRNALVSGIIFLAFALGSYLVYRFETAVGRQEKSVGLTADGMHSKADMVASLIAGFSLILYHLGINVDRWAAGIIAIFILSFALETLINSTLAAMRRRKGAFFGLKSHKIQTALLDRECWFSLAEFFRNRTVLDAVGSSVPRKALRVLLLVGIVGFAGWLASTCFFTVGISEQAVVERFGRPIAPESPLGPGLYRKFPWPIDAPVLLDTAGIRQVAIGNEVDENAFELLWTWEHGAETPFLSGDDNYFYPYLVIHYRINNIYDFLYRHADPEGLLKSTAYGTMTRLFSTRDFYEIVLDYRTAFGRDILGETQKEMDRLRAGIEIVSVNVKDIHPPITVASSFEKVTAALQEKEEMISKALGYATEYLLESRGETYRIEKEAAAYSLEIRLRAEGDAAHFLARIPEGEKAKAVTRKRLYLEALQKALFRRDKLLVDPRVGVPEIWLNFGEAFGSGGLEFDKAQF